LTVLLKPFGRRKVKTRHLMKKLTLIGCIA